MNKERLRNEFNRDVTLAWHIEKMHRYRRLPPLKNLLARELVKQTPQQMKGTVKLMADYYGLRLVKGKKRAK